MVIFDPPFFLKGPDRFEDVIVGGKNPKVTADDLNLGIARFGGMWRQPSYLFAYLRSAAIIVSQAHKECVLDECALPAFFLQRHCLELILKRLLTWMHEIAEMRIEIGVLRSGAPTPKQKKNLTSSHDLKRLYADLSAISQDLKLSMPPKVLETLIAQFANFEISSTWSRYATSGLIERHVENEIVVPVLDMQRSLERVVQLLIKSGDKDEVYEDELYDEWLLLAREVGRAG